MVLAPEKADQEVNQHVPQDLDGRVLRPGVSTVGDDESKKEGGDEGSIHSQSSADTIEPVPVGAERPRPSKSEASSVRSRTLSVVPRSERRGLLGRLSIIPEVERPYDYRNSTKWLITFIVALAASAAPLGSAIFFREFLYSQVARGVDYLGIQRTIVLLRNML
jgi:hypothetical protein